MVLTLFLAAGCGGSRTTPTFGEFGGPGFHSIDCSRTSSSWEECYKRANELCDASGGFYVLREYEDTGSTPELGHVVLRTLYIRCFPTSTDLLK